MAPRTRPRGPRPPKTGPDGETRFEAFAPTFDRFPGFAAADFDAYAKAKQRDPGANGERLVVKRKLHALGTALTKIVLPRGLDVAMRTSLSHPFKHNAFRVSVQSLYWGRGEKAKRALRRLLGQELADDLGPTAHGVVLLVELDQNGLRCGLRLHQRAWWDAQNLKRKVRRSETDLRDFLELLRALPDGYTLSIRGYRRRHDCSSMGPAQLAGFFQLFEPGTHGLELLREIGREKAIAEGDRIQEIVARLLKPTIEPLRAILWSRKNDALALG